MPKREKPELIRLASERGASVKALSVAAGVSRITVWRHATGKRSPTLDERTGYAKEMRVPIEVVDDVIARAMGAASKEAMSGDDYDALLRDVLDLPPEKLSDLVNQAMATGKVKGTKAPTRRAAHKPGRKGT